MDSNTMNPIHNKKKGKNQKGKSIQIYDSDEDVNWPEPVPYGGRRPDKKKEHKANWDSPKRRLLLQLVLKEIEQGEGRGTTCIGVPAFKKVCEFFWKEHKIWHTHIQIKNEYGNLRKLWAAWQLLTNPSSPVTGVGLNPITGAVDAPPFWWTGAESMNPIISRFRSAPLEHQDLMRAVFQAVTTTGKNSYNPSQKAPLDLDDLDLQEGTDSSDEGGAEELQSIRPELGATADNSGSIPPRVGATGNGSSTGTEQRNIDSGDRPKRKENPSTMTNTSSTWEKNERRQFEVTTKMGKFMTHEAVVAVTALPGMAGNTRFKLWALDVLVHSQAKVDVFMMQSTDAERWEWLEFEHESATIKHAKGSQTFVIRPPPIPNWRVYCDPTPYYVPPPSNPVP